MRTIIGILISFLTFCSAFAMAAGGGHGLTDMLGKMNFGAIGGLIHADVTLALGGILLGGLLIAFRPVDLFACLTGCCTRHELPQDELRINLLICQAGCRLALFGGMAYSVVSVIIVMMYRIGGDTTLVGQGIAVAMSASLWGVLFSALFGALKSKFLHQIKPGQ